MEKAGFFQCRCWKWCDEPAGFDERKHFVQCTCGQTMRYGRGCTPEELHLPQKDKIEGKIISQ